MPGYKTGHLERDTLGVSSKETERVELARAADVCLRELVGIGSAAVLKFILVLFVIIIQRPQVSVARHFQNRTLLDADVCQLFNSCFNCPALWLEKVFHDSSSGVSLMIDFIMWLFLLTPIGCRLYQTSPRRGKVDRLCIVREDDAKGTR